MAYAVGDLRSDKVPKQPTRPEIVRAGPFMITIRWNKNAHEDTALEILAFDVEWRLASPVIIGLESGHLKAEAAGDAQALAYEKYVNCSFLWERKGCVAEIDHSS